MSLRNWNVGLRIQLFPNVLLRGGSLRACLSFCVWFEFACNTSIVKSQRSSAGIPSIRKPASREIIFRLCWTVWHTCLFLAHPAYWNKRVTSEYAQCSSRSGFWILKISRKVRVLKQSQSALILCSFCVESRWREHSRHWTRTNKNCKILFLLDRYWQLVSKMNDNKDSLNEITFSSQRAWMR